MPVFSIMNVTGGLGDEWGLPIVSHYYAQLLGVGEGCHHQSSRAAATGESTFLAVLQCPPTQPKVFFVMMQRGKALRAPILVSGFATNMH